jgi:hypothetical protein
LKNIKTQYFLNFYLSQKNKQIKIQNLLIGSLDNKRNVSLTKSIKAQKIYFFDSYKVLHKNIKKFQVNTCYVVAIPGEYESNAIVQNIQGQLTFVQKVITSKSQVIKSYGLLTNILIFSFFKKYVESLKNLFNIKESLNNDVVIFNQIFELKNRLYSLLESKITFNNAQIKNKQKISKIYLMYETSSPYVNLNICSVDGPSQNSKTMLELN